MGIHAGNRNRPAYSGQARFRFPPEVLALFEARPPLPFKPPPRKRRLRAMSGVSGLLQEFESSEEHSDKVAAQKKNAFETPIQRRKRIAREKVTRVEAIVRNARKEYAAKEKPDGKVIEEKTKDAYKTLFVAKLAKDTPASIVRYEFERFGRIVKVVLPRDREGVSRGYAFVEFDDERDMKTAYREAAGMRIEGRRVLVDVERGRTVTGWLPNRLDGQYNAAAQAARKR